MWQCPPISQSSRPAPLASRKSSFRGPVLVTSAASSWSTTAPWWCCEKGEATRRRSAASSWSRRPQQPLPQHGHGQWPCGEWQWSSRPSSHPSPRPTRPPSRGLTLTGGSVRFRVRNRLDSRLRRVSLAAPVLLSPMFFISFSLVAPLSRASARFVLL